MQKRKKKIDKTILAITDFTKSSTNAMLFAAHIFKDVNLKFKLLNVFENPAERATLLISVEDILTKDSETGLKKQSAEIASVLNSPKLNISCYSKPGRLKPVIDTILQTEPIDLIVSGIPADKYNGKNLNNVPLLFMGRNKLPLLMVPEKISDSPVKNILIINLDAQQLKTAFVNKFESFVNHDHISKHVIYINEKKIDHALAASVNDLLIQREADLIIVIPAPGDKIDRAIQGYSAQELYPAIDSLLNP